MSDTFDAHKTLEEAHERGQHAPEGPRWTALATAVLAVLAALANLASNQRATAALLAKNEAILAQAKASDQWNFYQAKSIKQHVYEAVSQARETQSGVQFEKLRSIADRERKEKKPAMEHARELEKDAERNNEHSERLLQSHETLEIAVTILEVAIVVMSVATLSAVPILSAISLGAAAIGAVFFLFGFFAR